MTLASAVETIIELADTHAEESGDADHAIGDLQDALRLAWRRLSTADRRQVLSDLAEQREYPFAPLGRLAER